MSEHSKEPHDLRERLDADLKKAGDRAGVALVWTAVEATLIDMACDAADRLDDLREAYAVAEPKLSIRLASEVRQTEAHLVRLLSKIKPEAPKKDSRTSQKARAAANVRWARDRNA